jgi:hypothetical protein
VTTFYTVHFGDFTMGCFNLNLMIRNDLAIPGVESGLSAYHLLWPVPNITSELYHIESGSYLWHGLSIERVIAWKSDIGYSRVCHQDNY